VTESDRDPEEQGRAVSPMSIGSPRSAQPWLARARARYETTFVRGVISRLVALDFTNQAVLLGAGLLISLLPFLIFISAFADERVDDDLALHLGLDERAAQIVSHLFSQGALSFNGATAVSLIFAVLGTLAVVTSLQEIYEKVFDQSHRGLRDIYRIVIWVLAMCAVAGLVGEIGGPVRRLPGGFVLSELLTFAILTPFVWWTMHFLLAGRVPWRTLFPAAVATAIFALLLGAFSRLYFSSTIIADDRTYGAIGAVFSLVTWLTAVGAVIILGAVAGGVWHERSRGTGGRAQPTIG
jgi:membrane protein